jgi:CRISPR-associated protein Cas2
MLLMILEKVPTSLKGALSRWLIQLRTGTFLGNPSRRVRDELWTKACKKVGDKGCVLQVWSARNEQGFDHRQHGNTEHMLLDYEGLTLVTKLRRKAPKRKPKTVGQNATPSGEGAPVLVS